MSLVTRKHCEHNWQDKANLKLPASALGIGAGLFWTERGQETVNLVIYGPGTELHAPAFWGSKFEAAGKSSICNFHLRNFEN